MEITEQLLRENGWDETPGGFSHDIIEWRLRLYVWFEKDGHSHVSFESFNPSFTRLPNVTSMEALTQLEFLLSEYRIVNTALIDAAIEKEFGDG